jgi:hypothetical protein
MVLAAIAIEVLKQDDPETLARVLDTLRQHPQYTDRFAHKLESRPPEDRDLYLFMLAARWPDDVRRNAEYHRGGGITLTSRTSPMGSPIRSARGLPPSRTFSRPTRRTSRS